MIESLEEEFCLVIGRDRSDSVAQIDYYCYLTAVPVNLYLTIDTNSVSFPGRADCVAFSGPIFACQHFILVLVLVTVVNNVSQESQSTGLKGEMLINMLCYFWNVKSLYTCVEISLSSLSSLTFSS